MCFSRSGIRRRTEKQVPVSCGKGPCRVVGAVSNWALREGGSRAGDSSSSSSASRPLVCMDAAQHQSARGPRSLTRSPPDLAVTLRGRKGRGPEHRHCSLTEGTDAALHAGWVLERGLVRLEENSQSELPGRGDIQGLASRREKYFGPQSSSKGPGTYGFPRTANGRAARQSQGSALRWRVNGTGALTVFFEEARLAQECSKAPQPEHWNS